MRKIKCGLIIGLCLLSAGLQAEKHRFMVFFSDKSETKYSTEAPLEFLSQKALERRDKSGVEVTEMDFPVNQNYLDSLLKYNIQPYFTSRWFNAALVEADSADLENIVKEDYISSYEYVAPGVRLNEERQSAEFSFSPLQPTLVESNSYNQLEMLGAQTMHEHNYTGDGVHIAVLDGGFNMVDQSSVFAHLFNNNQIVDRLNFTTNSEEVFTLDGHGTSALSCITANYKDALTGTAYDADISLYITEDVSNGGSFEYRIEEYNWLFAAERADSIGVDIISSSLGYTTFSDSDMDYVYDEDSDGETSVISRAAAYVSQRGVLVVVSAGNDGRNSWQYVSMPADVEEVLTVGAVTSSNVRAGFSSIGPTADGRIKPDIVALGQSVALYKDDNTIGTANGTSFSAPLIAGLAAGIWQQFPALTNQEVKDMILSIGDKTEAPDNEVGYGLPNYRRLINDNVLNISDLFEQSFTVFPNPFNTNYVSILVEREYARNDLRMKLYDPNGRLIVNAYQKRVKRGDVITLDFAGDATGIYVLSLQSGDLLKNVKLLRY